LLKQEESKSKMLNRLLRTQKKKLKKQLKKLKLSELELKMPDKELPLKVLLRKLFLSNKLLLRPKLKLMLSKRLRRRLSKMLKMLN